ncbi:ABC transporter permease subunit [Brachybacterium sp. YJGR34]|uniref:ABC transporter permease subunit n=1 Tax=Brachybacterium sp. YJGR34 TaxID=2059911 RepID=UPI000E0A9439|nr:ABC transporter permease subunit [Brachybacterium sp. YJGR34]
MPSSSAPAARERSTSIPAVLARVVLLGTVLAVTAFTVPITIAQQQWMWLIVILGAAAGIFVLYSTRRFIPGKYLFPGTALLAVFLVTPIILTVGYSFTNFGDGTRGTKQEAVDTIVASSVQQSEDSTWYTASVATTGDATEGPFTLFLVDPADGTVLRGAADEPLEAVDPSAVTVAGGAVTDAAGYEILDAREVNAAYDTLQELAVPVDDSSAVRLQGPDQAFEGTTVITYDAAADTLTDTSTGEVYTVGTVGDSEYFVDAEGERAFSQSWLQGVGLGNYERLVTDGKIAQQFAGAFVWTLAFALGSVGLTFVVGFALALVLNDPRLRGRRAYRSILLMPYAVPGFISLLVWSNFYNRDFGLINQTLGLDLNWLGDPTLAKVAVLLTNLWMGFPYMFIVSTGALQAIPGDVMEAARIDGASRLQTTAKVVTPLLLVAVAPLLVASFAFNFNNFNAIQLLTEGGPFLPGEYTRGGTDILISMIYRIAFGGSGADFGFASAVSVVLFAITGVLAMIQFRFTNVLEDVN